MTHGDAMHMDWDVNVTSQSCAMQGPLFQDLGQALFKAERVQMCVHVGEEGRGQGNTAAPHAPS